MYKRREEELDILFRRDASEILKFLELDRPRGISMLVTMLRSGRNIPEPVRNLLAEMIDPAGNAMFRLDLKRNGKRGRSKKAVDIDIGEAMKMRREWGEPFKVALHDVMMTRGVKRHRVTDALRESREGFMDDPDGEVPEDEFGK